MAGEGMVKADDFKCCPLGNDPEKIAAFFELLVIELKRMVCHGVSTLRYRDIVMINERNNFV